MTHIISITNQKGGVGKTTTATNLSAALARNRKRTLLLDLDPQGNATTGMGLNKKAMDTTLYHALIGQVGIESIVYGTEVEHLDVIPSRTELAGMEAEIMQKPQREHFLKKAIAPLHDRYDYIIIDCPPSLSLLTVNAMTAATGLIIPLQCEFYALEGLGQLIQTIRLIKKGYNPSLGVAGILLTMFDQRVNLSHQVADEAVSHFKDLVFETRIPRNVRLGEAPSFGKPILLYDPHSTGSKSYMALAKELIKKDSRRRTQAS